MACGPGERKMKVTALRIGNKSRQSTYPDVFIIHNVCLVLISSVRILVFETETAGLSHSYTTADFGAPC